MPHVDIHKRPHQAPVDSVPEKDIRIYYLGYWFDFRDGQILITQDRSYKPMVEIEVRRVKS